MRDDNGKPFIATLYKALDFTRIMRPITLHYYVVEFGTYGPL